MSLSKPLVMVVCLTISTAALADSQSVDAALGGALGGGLGALVGNEVGGRNGAIVGGALGAAAGAAVATDDYPHRSHGYLAPRAYRYGAPYYHCPPGQAKKGRC